MATPSPIDHGTRRGAAMERRRGLPVCAECLMGESLERQRHREANPERYRRANRADSRAKALLVRRHREEYRALYLKAYMEDKGPRV